ncbi:MAG: cytochrome c biogenesis protein CcsA [Paludibacter sp.]|nr:cytochrome c biogenesis protein CcsA [Paludibacter sp.]
MSWDHFTAFAIPVLISWMLAIITLFATKKRWLNKIFTLAGIVGFATFIVLLWISLDRPPMRTMGETRLWYTFFLSTIGFVMYAKWKYSWIQAFSLVVASVFVFINIFKPEIHSKNLMPALQSIWFVPHVTAYILSYSFLSAAAISAVILLWQYKKQKETAPLEAFTDNLVYVGFGLLMTGLLIGAIWAKEAWGHYWSWDPKETWAFITAAAYLIYIHVRLRESRPKKFTLWLIIFSFIFLMITWKGVAYLPSAQGSVHVYSE